MRMNFSLKSISEAERRLLTVKQQIEQLKAWNEENRIIQKCCHDKGTSNENSSFNDINYRWIFKHKIPDKYRNILKITDIPDGPRYKNHAKENNLKNGLNSSNRTLESNMVCASGIFVYCVIIDLN